MWDFIVKYGDLIIMPFTYGFVGWFTNWIALKMTFYPLKFWGIPPFLGWQGIIPRKAHKMASKSVDVITEKLIKIEEVFDKIDPNQVQKELKNIIDSVSSEVVKDVIDDINPRLWDILPERAREEIIKNAKQQSGDTIKGIIQDIRKNIYSVFDLKALVLKSLTGNNVKLIVDMFLTVGKPEFRFIELSGLWFGLILGTFQIGIWLLYPEPWTLPVQGIIVGYLTNWLALKMIFEPLYPKKFLGFTIHGLFIKRQAEVSELYAKLVAEKILNPKKILEEILYGRAADDVLGLIRKSVAKAVEATAGIAKPVLTFAVGTEQYEQIKVYVVEKMTSLLPRTAEKLEKYLGQALDLENTMATKMKQLSPKEFETILRSAFQEDEFLLILIGAVLGAIVGYGQAAYMQPSLIGL